MDSQLSDLTELFEEISRLLAGNTERLGNRLVLLAAGFLMFPVSTNEGEPQTCEGIALPHVLDPGQWSHAHEMAFGLAQVDEIDLPNLPIRISGDILFVDIAGQDVAIGTDREPAGSSTVFKADHFPPSGCDPLKPEWWDFRLVPKFSSTCPGATLDSDWSDNVNSMVRTGPGLLAVIPLESMLKESWTWSEWGATPSLTQPVAGTTIFVSEPVEAGTVLLTFWNRASKEQSGHIRIKTGIATELGNFGFIALDGGATDVEGRQVVEESTLDLTHVLATLEVCDSTHLTDSSKINLGKKTGAGTCEEIVFPPRVRGLSANFRFFRNGTGNCGPRWISKT